MPYYHGYNISGSWEYIAEQVHWYKNYTPVPLVISEVGVFAISEPPQNGRG
jgi:hypothetical protein